MKLVVFLILASVLRAEEPQPPTPEQRIELLKAIITKMDAEKDAQADQVKTLTELLQYFQNKLTPAGAMVTARQKQLDTLRESIEKQCGCKIDGEGLPVKAF